MHNPVTKLRYCRSQHVLDWSHPLLYRKTTLSSPISMIPKDATQKHLESKNPIIQWQKQSKHSNLNLQERHPSRRLSNMRGSGIRKSWVFPAVCPLYSSRRELAIHLLRVLQLVPRKLPVLKREVLRGTWKHLGLSHKPKWLWVEMHNQNQAIQGSHQLPYPSCNKNPVTSPLPLGCRLGLWKGSLLKVVVNLVRNWHQCLNLKTIRLREWWKHRTLLTRVNHL